MLDRLAPDAAAGARRMACERSLLPVSVSGAVLGLEEIQHDPFSSRLEEIQHDPFSSFPHLFLTEDYLSTLLNFEGVRPLYSISDAIKIVLNQ